MTPGPFVRKPLSHERRPAWPAEARYQLGDRVQKKGHASWRGIVVGWYRTELTALGYAVESLFEPGSVQIYPETALDPWHPVREPE
jgi:dihydrofolate reductase (trimethoprim resistance protein)